MKVFGAHIAEKVSLFLNDYLQKITSFEIANQKIFKAFGIIDIFDNNEELERLKDTIADTHNIAEEDDRAEYGNFQTNIELAKKNNFKFKQKKYFT